jgi:hypothetical protein
LVEDAVVAKELVDVAEVVVELVETKLVVDISVAKSEVMFANVVRRADVKKLVVVAFVVVESTATKVFVEILSAIKEAMRPTVALNTEVKKLDVVAAPPVACWKESSSIVP